MIQNLHTHVTFCDGKNTPEEMVHAAIRMDMDALGFSSHAPLAGQSGWTMSPEDGTAITEAQSLTAEMGDGLLTLTYIDPAGRTEMVLYDDAPERTGNCGWRTVPEAGARD